MSIEGGDIPQESPDNRGYDAASKGSFEGMTSDEIPLTPSDVPATEHQPQFFTAEDQPATPLPFGVKRFIGSEPSFDGIPPDEYLDATFGRFHRAVWGEDGVLGRNGLFEDINQATSTRPDGLTVSQVTHNTELEYVTPHGRWIDVGLNRNQLELREVTHGGDTYFTRYYRSWRELTPGADNVPQALRKDTRDTSETILPPTSGASLNDINLQRYDDLNERRSDETAAEAMGIVDPLVGVEEADYIFDEVLANAWPARKSADDLVDIIRSQAEGDARIMPMERYDAVDTVNKIVTELRTRYNMPHTDIGGARDMAVQTVDSYGEPVDVALRILTDQNGNEQAAGSLLMTTERQLEGSALHDAADRRRLLLPPAAKSRVIKDEIRCIFTPRHVQVTVLTHARGAMGTSTIHNEYILSPATLPAIRTIRNYLLGGPQPSDEQKIAPYEF